MLVIPFIFHSTASAQGWKLVWSDEFNAGANTGADQSKWRYNEWNPGTVNQEKQKYTRRTENVFHNGNGHMIIRGLRDNWSGFEYTSGRLESAGKMQFRHTRKVTVRAILPQGKGSWPALWLLGASGQWPECGEIDFMEQWGDNKTTVQCDTHTGSQSGNIEAKTYRFKNDTTSVTEFHEYAVEWYQDSIVFFVDNKQFGISRFQGGPFSTNDHYLILNVAIGGMMGKEIDNEKGFPMDMVIDYVRVYEYDPNASAVINKRLGSENAIKPIVTLNNNHVSVRYSDQLPFAIEFSDASGKVIARKSIVNGVFNFNRSLIADGVYFLNIQKKGSLYTQKVFIF